MSTEAETVVVCLCAEWCGVCRDYRDGFDAMARERGDVAFHWVDIEDESDWPDSLEVESFPTVMIQRGNEVLFLGPTLPQHSHLARTLDNLVAMTADEAHRYARATEERRGWQVASGFRRTLIGR